MDGLAIGVVFGILQDMLFGQIIGISALIYLILGIILKFMRTVVFKDNRILLLFVVIFFHTVLHVGVLAAQLCHAADGFEPAVFSEARSDFHSDEFHRTIAYRTDR